MITSYIHNNNKFGCARFANRLGQWCSFCTIHVLHMCLYVLICIGMFSRAFLILRCRLVHVGLQRDKLTRIKCSQARFRNKNLHTTFGMVCQPRNPPQFGASAALETLFAKAWSDLRRTTAAQVTAAAAAAAAAVEAAARVRRRPPLYSTTGG